MESDAQYLEILQRWDEEANVEAIYHEVPARHLQMERSHTVDDLLGIEQASYSEWGNLCEDPTDLASEPSTSSRKAGSNVKTGGGRRKRMTKRQLVAAGVPEDQKWTKCLVPASRIPELLIQREDMLQKIKEFNNTRTEVKGRWHRAFEMAMEGHEVDRALRNVRDISSKIRQYMFFSESQNSVLKLSSTLSEYDRVWERKRFSRLSAGLSDLSRLAYPIEQLVDARTFECHEIVQQELSAAVQNELSRRAEPMELQRLDRETENTLKQAEVGRKSVNKKLDDLQHSIHHTARNASHFVKNLKNTLQTVLSDISDFHNAHVTLKKADKDYKADFFDQIRRNDGYKDQLEKLTARRKLAEGRNQADLETLRSEHTILKRSLATLMTLYEECSTRASEIASWLHVLSHQRIEKSSDLMLEVHEGRMHRRRDMFKRIAWLDLQRLSVEIASLRDNFRSSSETLRKKRLEKDVELYRVITCDAKVLLLELRGRCNELNVDGSLKKDINALLSGAIPYQGFFDVIAKELNEQADWLRGRHMNVGISPASLTLSSQGLRLATPTSLLSVADKLLHQRHLKMVVIRNMRRASMPMEEKVEQITQRFKLALLARRHSQTEDDADESLADESSADMEDEIERMTEGIDDQTLRQIITQHGDLDLALSEVQNQPDQGSVADALSQLQELSASEGHLHHALAHLLHQLHGAGLEELHDVLKEKLQDITEAWHIAVTAAHSTPEVREGPEMEKSMLWKIREQRFAWLVPLAHQLAKRFGHLRACNEVLWAELGQLGDATYNAERREQVATSVAALLRSLEPLATEEVIKAGEKCMRSFQQVLHGKLHLLEAASKACAHLRHLPDINLVPSDGIAEALPSGPSPHTFVTAIKALIKLLRSDAFVDAKVFDRFTGPEILNILCEAVSREFKAALPDCFRAAMLALADLGEMFQDYEGGEASMSLSLGLFAGGSQTLKETWGALRAGARQRMEGGTPLADTPSDGFQLSNSRPLLSRERSQTASSRPWTSTPARPSTEDSTRLPSRQHTDRPSLDLTLEDPPPRLSPDDFPEGQPLDQQDLEFELEKQRLQQANAEQENDLRKLHQEEKELDERLAFLRKSVSQMSQSSEAWRVGELMEELEQVEEARQTIKATVAERQKVTELLKEQRSGVDQQQLLHRERAKIMRSQSLMPRSQSGKGKSMEWARSESRLTAIGHKMGRLQSELSLKRGATSALEATVVTLEREKSKSQTERQNEQVEEKVPKVLTEQEMIAAYATRVAMRSLWKVQSHKVMQAQQAAQIFCKQLLAPHQAQRVLFEDVDSPTKPGKATKKRGSLRRAATKPVRGKEGRKGTKTSTSPTSASAKTSASRGSLKRATLHRHPVPQVAQSEDICIGSTSKPSAHGAHGQPKLKRDVTQVLSTRRASRASIESRRSSVDAGGPMESVLSVGAARATTVPVISVRSASPRSSANSSSSSAADSGAESEQLEDATVTVPVQRRHNIMTDLLETKALRNEVQASLGEQELEKSNQWAEDWIRRKSMQDDANQEELSMPDGKHLLRRTGLAEITPLLADSALGLDVDLAGLDDSSDEETLQRNPATLVEDFIQSSAAATVKPKQAQPRIRGREAVRLSTTLKGPPVLFAQSKDSTQAKGPKSARSKSRKKERTLKADGKEDLSRGFLADPLVKKLEREFGHQRSLKDSSRMSSRREVSTSTTREPGDPEAEGLQEDSLMAMSSVHSTEKYGYLSHRAIAEAVGDDPRARREHSSIPLPRLVAVRKDGPGDAEAVQYVAKGRKGVVSAAMVQAARMHPGKSSRSRPTSKQEFRVQTDAAVEMPDNLMPLMPDDPTSSRDRPAVHFPEASDLEEELNSLRVPQTRMPSAGRVSRTSEASPSPSGWSHSHQGEVAARSSRTAGSVLTTRPRECTPMLTARAKKYFNGASLR